MVFRGVGGGERTLLGRCKQGALIRAKAGRRMLSWDYQRQVGWLSLGGGFQLEVGLYKVQPPSKGGQRGGGKP